MSDLPNRDDLADLEYRLTQQIEQLRRELETLRRSFLVHAREHGA